MLAVWHSTSSLGTSEIELPHFLINGVGIFNFKNGPITEFICIKFAVFKNAIFYLILNTD